MTPELSVRTRELALRLLAALALPVAACSGAGSGADAPEVTVPTSSASAGLLTNAAPPSSALARPPKDPADQVWYRQPGNALCMPESLTSRDGDTKACGYSPGEWIYESKLACGGCDYSLDDLATRAEREKRDDACCYQRQYYMKGRPLIGDAGLVLAPLAPSAAWAIAGPREIAARVPAQHRAALAARYLETAALEHASVAEFSRVSLSLLSLGAPAELVLRVHEAALDEVRHAELTYALGSALLGRSVGPGPLDVGASRPVAQTRLALFEHTLHDGCIGETLAALEMRRAADEANDPELGALLGQVADDETRHAELAYAMCRWLSSSATADEAPALEAALRDALGCLDDASPPAGSRGASSPELPELPELPDLRGLGYLTRDEQRRVRDEGLAVAVRPALAAMLAELRAASTARASTLRASTAERLS